MTPGYRYKDIQEAIHMRVMAGEPLNNLYVCCDECGLLFPGEDREVVSSNIGVEFNLCTACFKKVQAEYMARYNSWLEKLNGRSEKA